MKIKAQKREIKGKKVKSLRVQGQTPASVYGPGRESMDITIDPKEFLKVFKTYGYNKIYDVDLEGETIKVLNKEIQHNPVTGDILHVSLYAINMKKKIVVEIPVRIEGVSPAVKSNLGFLVSPVESVPVMCLPTNIPEEIKVNIDTLANINDTIRIKDIKLPENVEWESGVSPELVIATVAPPQKEIVEEVKVETEIIGEEGEKKEGEVKEGEAETTTEPAAK